MPVSWAEREASTLWHPYNTLPPDVVPWRVSRAAGVHLYLEDGRSLIDGMSSWWCAIHGYNHPQLNQAVQEQLARMAHVMFGGLTHSPALELAELLLSLLPPSLENVFYCDSGSVAVEVALKMALQYWQGKGEDTRTRIVSIKGAYHGDTFGAMSVCDPNNSLHTLFQPLLTEQYFLPRPAVRFGATCEHSELAPLAELLQQQQKYIAALILEPIVQGAGGMWFYSAEYLRHIRSLCDEYGVLLIADEIATGFGRSGRLFACEHAGIVPDILCVGKALTAGYMSFAAVLSNKKVADTVCCNETPFMHGPTYMANPLACSVAMRSIQLLLESPWQKNIIRIEQGLQKGLSDCSSLAAVKEVRVLGAIGVVELHQPVNMKTVQPALVEAGVWIRPFGRLMYLMPPYLINDAELQTLCAAIYQVIAQHCQ